MNIAWYLGGNASVLTPKGFVVRGVQLMKGLARNGHKVCIFANQGNDYTLEDNLRVVVSKNRIKALRQEHDISPFDVIYVRGHTYIKSIRREFPDVHICLELYLYPYDFTRMTVDFDIYKYIDSFVVVGKKYHEYSLYWLSSFFQQQNIKPNRWIQPSFDERKRVIAIQQQKKYIVSIFDGINQSHRTLDAVKASVSFCKNNVKKGSTDKTIALGTGYVKDPAMYHKIQSIRASRIDFVSDANINNIHEYYGKSITSIVLYEQPQYSAQIVTGKVTDFLVSLRLIEALGYGCIPIVSKSIANEEYLGQYLDIFSVDPSTPANITNKLKDIISRPHVYKKQLQKLNIDQWSNIVMGKNLGNFLENNYRTLDHELCSENTSVICRDRAKRRAESIRKKTNREKRNRAKPTLNDAYESEIAYQKSKARRQSKKK